MEAATTTTTKNATALGRWEVEKNMEFLMGTNGNKIKQTWRIQDFLDFRLIG